jgi:hypothetical protein
MRKRWITLIALLAGVVALGLFVWLKPPKPPAATYALSALKFNDARTLRVLRKGKTLAALEKRNGEWSLTEPMTAPADDFQVLRVLAIGDAKSALQYPATELAKFELDAPHTEIIINDQRFAFGTINTVTREQYVLTQNQVFPVALNYGAAVPTDANALLRRSVLAPGDAPLRFEFSAFTVATDAKKWSTTPAADELSQDDYNRWVAQWREGSGLRTEVIDKRTPATEIHITLKHGVKVTLGVVQTAPELVLRRADLGLQFVFVGDIGKQMLAPPVARK